MVPRNLDCGWAIWYIISCYNPPCLDLLTECLQKSSGAMKISKMFAQASALLHLISAWLWFSCRHETAGNQRRKWYRVIDLFRHTVAKYLCLFSLRYPKEIPEEIPAEVRFQIGKRSRMYSSRFCEHVWTRKRSEEEGPNTDSRRRVSRFGFSPKI